MISASDVVTAVGPSVFDLVVPGEQRHVDDVFLAEPDSDAVGAAGDLVLGVGATDPVGLVARCADTGSAALVLREDTASRPEVREAALERRLPLVSLRPGVAWVYVVWILRGVIDRAAAPGSPAAGDAGVHNELFVLADTMATVAGAPVTIEDNRSRVLAYSVGQGAIDPARASTIIGRRVPPEVVAHFRARGVFRRLARSSEPFLVPEGPEGTLPRLVVPVRAGDEWLGSVWVVVAEPPADHVIEELRNAASVLALHLLRLRAQADVARRTAAERLGLALRRPTPEPASLRLPAPPWRAVALHSGASLPSGQAAPSSGATRRVDTASQAGAAEEEAAYTTDVWAATLRRNGWSEPRLTDLDGTTFAVVSATGSAAGSWSWLVALLADAHGADRSVRVAAGRPVSDAGLLPRSRAEAEELMRLSLLGRLPGPVHAFEDAWAAVTLDRATTGLDPATVAGPLALLDDHDRQLGTDYVATLRAWLAHPGDPRRAAEELHIHPNTLRHRIRRITSTTELGLHLPAHRLALQIQIEALAHRSE